MRVESPEQNRRLLPPDSQVRIEALRAEDAEALAAFFAAIAADPETVRFFHPHPFTPAYARRLCDSADQRLDRYYALWLGGQIVGYSMLRGWDEGYAVPSFGVCLHPDHRNSGLGQRLLSHAIQETQTAGARQLRLSVYRDNERAVHIYRKHGFEFREKNAEELIGVLDV